MVDRNRLVDQIGPKWAERIKVKRIVVNGTKVDELNQGGPKWME